MEPAPRPSTGSVPDHTSTDLEPNFDALRWSPVWAAGVDEAGRGPLAGPVVAAAVVLHPGRTIDGLRDSKKISAARRRRLADAIRRHSASFCVARAEVEEIDRLNILRATMLAMERAVAGLGEMPQVVYVDGNRLPAVACPAVALVQGDDRMACISAASILAKVARDDEMCAEAERYPGYGFEVHKGYGTRRHMEALRSLGPCPLHRRSFAPVARALEHAVTEAAV